MKRKVFNSQSLSNACSLLRPLFASLESQEASYRIEWYVLWFGQQLKASTAWDFCALNKKKIDRKVDKRLSFFFVEEGGNFCVANEEMSESV